MTQETQVETMTKAERKAIEKAQREAAKNQNPLPKQPSSFIPENEVSDTKEGEAGNSENSGAVVRYTVSAEVAKVYKGGISVIDTEKLKVTLNGTESTNEEEAKQMVKIFALAKIRNQFGRKTLVNGKALKVADFAMNGEKVSLRLPKPLINEDGVILESEADYYIRNQKHLTVWLLNSVGAATGARIADIFLPMEESLFTKQD